MAASLLFSSSEDSDFVRVKLPAQKVSRDKGGWLYHRNMVGLMPALKHLLSSPFIEQYDWFINTELDHFLSPVPWKIFSSKVIQISL